jgi:hypothetical protein
MHHPRVRAIIASVVIFTVAFPRIWEMRFRLRLRDLTFFKQTVSPVI